MSNSSQVDKQPGAHQPGDQQQCSQGPGAATDMEQPQTWSSYSLGPLRRADEYHMYYIDEQKYFVHKLKNSCKIPWFDIV